MDINRMKLGLMFIFKENNKIPNKSKLQLINFIEQADAHQLKVLAMDGELVPKYFLDEDIRKIIDSRYDTEAHIEGALQKSSVAAMKNLVEIGPKVAGAAGLAIGAAATYKVMKKRAAKRKCQKLHPSDTAKYNQCIKVHG